MYFFQVRFYRPSTTLAENLFGFLETPWRLLRRRSSCALRSRDPFFLLYIQCRSRRLLRSTRSRFKDMPASTEDEKSHVARSFYKRRFSPFIHRRSLRLRAWNFYSIINPNTAGCLVLIGFTAVKTVFAVDGNIRRRRDRSWRSTMKPRRCDFIHFCDDGGWLSGARGHPEWTKPLRVGTNGWRELGGRKRKWRRG